MASRVSLDDTAQPLDRLEVTDSSGVLRLRDELNRLADRSPSETAALIRGAALALAAPVPGAVGRSGSFEESANTSASDPNTRVVSQAARTPGGSDASESIAARPFSADKELIELFIAESLENLREAEESLLQLESDSSDAESVNRVFRCFHSIKGTSSFLGFERISELSHRAESLLSRVRDGSIEFRGGYADLALRSVDILSALVRSIGKPREPGSGPAAGYPELVAALKAATESDAAPDEASSAVDVELFEPEATEPGESYVRIRSDQLDRVIEAVTALAVVQSEATVAARDGGRGDVLLAALTRAESLARELQLLGTALRSGPVRPLFQRVARLCRDGARRYGKNVEFASAGEDAELDRAVLDLLADPILHMARNAIDHGIEPPVERRRNGKSAIGTISMSVKLENGRIAIDLSDDGRGLDMGRIRAKAIAQGLLRPGEACDPEQAASLIFAPGFSTADRVTALSGRGVGLDVVRRNLESLRGRIEVESRPGEGTRFRLIVPHR